MDGLKRTDIPERSNAAARFAAGSELSLEDFDAKLSARTRVSSEQVARYADLSEDALAAVVVLARQAADRVQRTLGSLLEDPARVDAEIDELGIEFFTDENGWRALIARLRTLAADYDDYKVLAVAKYRRFLLARAELLNRVCCDRQLSAIHGHAASSTEDRTRLADTSASMPAVTSGAMVRELARLPRGCTSPVVMRDSASLDVWMGSRRFRIEVWQSPSLIDDKGRPRPLNEGRNLIGRALSNDVVIDPMYTEVSRRHMIVDVHAGQPVAITDLSSGGTFVSRSALAG